MNRNLIIEPPKNQHTQLLYEQWLIELGDAEYWYQLIRLIKPNRIFEVGSGNSTLMAIKASFTSVSTFASNILLDSPSLLYP
jgi:hypothetical protein